MGAIEVAEGIHWVGALDPDLRDFHGFEVEEGSTYNCYLVRGDKAVALVDTVNTEFMPQLLARVGELVDAADVDYIVVNHLEPDHAGGLLEAAAAFPNARVLCSAGAARAIPEFHGPDLAFTVVGPDDVIDLGGRTLRFLPMPMVHWPDSMFTYVAESRTLLPNDAFGQHICTEQRFADEVGVERILEAVDLYYANILMPLTGPISKAVEKLAAAGWELDVIAPSHGAIWRGEGVRTILGHYAELLAGGDDGSVVVAYATAWHSTESMAHLIADRLREAGVQVHVFDLRSDARSAVTRALLRARALVVGSATLHHAMLPDVAAYLQYIAGLKPAGKLGAAFGSYGWSSGATAQIRERMESIGFDMPLEDLQVKYRPLDSDLPAIDAWVESLIERVR